MPHQITLYRITDHTVATATPTCTCLWLPASSSISESTRPRSRIGQEDFTCNLEENVGENSREWPGYAWELSNSIQHHGQSLHWSVS